jgi:hypothetical protein
MSANPPERSCKACGRSIEHLRSHANACPTERCRKAVQEGRTVDPMRAEGEAILARLRALPVVSGDREALAAAFYELEVSDRTALLEVLPVQKDEEILRLVVAPRQVDRAEVGGVRV